MLRTGCRSLLPVRPMQMEVEGGELGRSVEILGTAGKSDAVAAWLRVEAVSYTHLTLPTILRV